MSSFCHQPEWIMDGNYTSTLNLRIQFADIVIFLDFPRSVSIARALKRLVYYRNRSRPDMPDGWRELYNKAFFKKIWQFNKIHRPRILALLDSNIDVKIYSISSPSDLEALLQNLA